MQGGKIQILIVDPEVALLEGLRRLLHPRRGEWQVHFATDAETANRCIDNLQFDLVVSDRLAPSDGGVRLLRRVADAHPGALRMLLTDRADEVVTAGLLDVAHQFLTRPFPPQALLARIERVARLQELLLRPELQQLVSHLEALPVLPEAYLALVHELHSAEPRLDRVATLVERDPALSSRVLQLVNSAFLGVQEPVCTPGHAVHLLGLEAVAALVLTHRLFATLDEDARARFHLDRLWSHSVRCGMLAGLIAAELGLAPVQQASAALAGLLHDVGKLVLVAAAPNRYRGVLLWADRHHEVLADVERHLLGCTHGELGAVVLGSWGLPLDVVEAVALHHRPRCLERIGNSPALAVALADQLDQQSHGSQLAGAVPLPDRHWLGRIGVAEQIGAWRAQAAEIGYERIF